LIRGCPHTASMVVFPLRPDSRRIRGGLVTSRHPSRRTTTARRAMKRTAAAGSASR
jgi:hypothetical protein